MSESTSARIVLAGWLCVLLLVSSAMAAPKHCAPVDGTFMTNVGGFGVSFGDFTLSRQGVNLHTQLDITLPWHGYA